MNQDWYLSLEANLSNMDSIVPIKYVYYAISDFYGYNSVTIKATSLNSAIQRGRSEYERRFGSVVYFIGIDTHLGYLGYYKIFKLGYRQQHRLCQRMMMGYVDNYKGYSRSVKSICRRNGIKNVSDEYIKFLFVNQLAKKYRYSSDLRFYDVSKYLIDFMFLLSSGINLEERLFSEYLGISLSNARKEYTKLCRLHPNYVGYFLTEERYGRYIRTESGKYKVGKDGLSSMVELFYNNKSLGLHNVG